MKKTLIFLFCISVFQFVYAGSVGPGDGLMTDAEHLKETVSQWGTTAAATAVFISGGLAVSSLILPWRFLKETLGRPAWIGLSCAVLTYIILSFFGNSIGQAVTRMVQCPLQIIGFPCM